MKTLFPVLLGTVVLASVLMPTITSARMNETEIQMQSRYGAPDNAPVPPMLQLLEGAITRVYNFKGWKIRAAFLKERVVRISYSKQPPYISSPAIQDDEAKAVLDAEVGNGKWEEIARLQPKPLKSLPWASSDKAWVHSNGNVACLHLSKMILQIDSPAVDEYLAERAAETETKRKASIPKF